MPKAVTKKTIDLIRTAGGLLTIEYPNNYRSDYQRLSRIMTQARESVERYIRTFKSITMKRLAILREDIERFNLPPLRVKDKDPRAKGFKQKYGGDAIEIEADALPPDKKEDQ